MGQTDGPIQWFDQYRHKDAGIIALVLSILILLVVYIFLFGDLKSSNTTILLGIVSFIIPIILAFSKRFNLSARFGNGEIRKAIVISLTIVYIVLLSTYFFNVSLPIGEKLNSSLGVISGSSLNASQTKTSGTGVEEKGNTTINMIPSEALKDITTNFFWVYAVIIIFYFGSRAWESVAETNMVKELKDINPQELLQRRYILGSISPENFKAADEDLSGDGVILLDAMPKGNGKYELIIRNLGSKDRKVITWSIDGIPVKGKDPVDISGVSYGTIEVDADNSKEHTFQITLDNEDTSGITRGIK
jgi:hypothetical protein